MITRPREVDRLVQLPPPLAVVVASGVDPVEQLHGAVRFSTVAAESKIRRLVRNVVHVGDSGVITAG